MKSEGVFSRLANWYNKGMKAASVYAPMISSALRNPLAKAILGSRAEGIADIIDSVNKQLPSIDKTIKNTYKSIRPNVVKYKHAI